MLNYSMQFYLFQDVEGEDLARTKMSRLTDHKLAIKAAASLSIHWLNSVGNEAVVFLPVGQTEGASGQDQDFGSLKLAKEFGHQGYIVEPFLLMWLQRPMAEQSIVRQLELCPTHKHTQHTSMDTHSLLSPAFTQVTLLHKPPHPVRAGVCFNAKNENVSPHFSSFY